MPRKNDPEALKVALQAKDIDILKQGLTDLTGLVKEGFKGTHERHDIANGKLGKAGEDIIKNRAETDLKFVGLKSDFKYNRIIWYLFTAAISIIIAMASYILFKPH